YSEALERPARCRFHAPRVSGERFRMSRQMHVAIHPRRLGARLFHLAFWATYTGLLSAQPSAQAVKQEYRFAVVSIRPGDPNGLMAGPPKPASPGRFNAESITMVGLAMRAFSKSQTYQIEFQPWMSVDRFNIAAVYPQGASPADLPAMLLHL